MNCFMNMIYFGLMSNFTLVPNTTSTCSSKDLCITSMCELSKQVDIVCFVPSGDYIETIDLVVPILCSIILFLGLYGVFITCIAWYHWRRY